MLSNRIRELEYKLVTHTSYRICGNNIENQLSYLKSEEDKLYSAYIAMCSYTNLSDTYDEVDKRELIYRCKAIRAAIIECKTIIVKREEQKKQEEEQKKQEEESYENYKNYILISSFIVGLGILGLIVWWLLVVSL